MHVNLTVREYEYIGRGEHARRRFVGEHHRYYDELEIHYSLWLIFSDDSFLSLWNLVGNSRSDIVNKYQRITNHLGVNSNMVWV